MTAEKRVWSVGGVVRAEANDGTLIFPLSSEEPYRRYDGVEILDHAPESVDLDWLNSGNAPLLNSHDRYSGLSAQIGIIKRAWLEAKRVMVEVRFSSRVDVQGFRQDVLDGVIRNVSVGYERQEIVKNEIDDTYRVTKWKPLEASFVAIPADMTVGIGRKDDPLSQETPMTTKQNEPSGAEGTQPARLNGLPGLTPTPAPVVDRSEELATAIGEINAMAAPHNQRDLADAFIAEAVRAGRVPSIAAFQGKLRAVLPQDVPIRNTDIGLSERERQSFSIVRLARTWADASGNAVKAAGFELAACEAAGEGKHGGFILPPDIMRSWNDAVDSEGNHSSTVAVRAAMGVSGNANVQAVDHLAARFIDNLRNASSVLQMGVTVLAGLDGNIEIPGGDTNAAAAWLGSEDANAAESVPTFRKVSMSIHDLAAYTDMTRRMLMQSTIDVEMYVRAQLLTAMALAIDLAGLQGSGAAGQPTGLKTTAGIGSVTFAGAVPTWGEIIDLESAVANANALTGNTGYLGNTALRGSLKQTPKVAGFPTYLMDSNDAGLNGHRYVASNQVVSNDLFFGNWSDMLMGLWGSLELGRSTEAKFLSGGLRLRAIQSVDFGVARVGSFALGT